MLTEKRIAHFGLAAAFAILAGSIAVLLAQDVRGSGRDTSKAPTGMQAPEIGLKDSAGKEISLTQLRGQKVIVCFDSPHYPAAATDYHERLKELANEYQAKVIEIQSDAEVDSQATATVECKDFTTVLDEKGKVASRYDVRVSPTFVLIDGHGLIQYRGALDDNVDEAKVRNHYLADALQSMSEGRPIGVAFVQAFGRPIK